MIARTEPKWTPVTNWAAIGGSWSFAEYAQRYEGLGPTSPPGAHGLALNDERFRDGVIRCKIKFEGPDTTTTGDCGGIVLGYQSESGNYHVAGLGAFEFEYGIWEFVAGSGWHRRKWAGSIKNLKYKHEYDLEVTLKGQRISLVVDRVPVLEHLLPSPLAGNQLGLYTLAQSPIQFHEYSVYRKQPTAFVAMQFGEPYDSLYRAVIRPKAEALGFDVKRIDEIKRPGIIFQEIRRKIEDAKVVIAEITAPNQNVYYEVGYAHALNKPTILLAQRGKDLPFDIRSYRVIFYDDSIGGKPAVEKSLREHLHSVLQDISRDGCGSTVSAGAVLRLRGNASRTRGSASPSATG